MANFNFVQVRPEVPIGTEVNFDFGTNVELNILIGTSNVMSAIWADVTAGRACGKMYVASTGGGSAFSVLDLQSKTLYDGYTVTLKGRANTVLQQEDTIDIVTTY